MINLRDSIGVALIAAFVSALATLFFKAIPPSNEQLIVYMLGQLSGFVAGVVAYHYTLSKSDEQKAKNTEKMADAIKAVAQANGTPVEEPDAILKPGETAQAEELKP